MSKPMDRDTLSEKISFWAHIRFGIDDEPEWAHDLADDILESIVPVASVPTEAERAAVGRLVRMESARLAMRVASGKSSAEWGAANDEWFSANNAIQPGDIEAAQRVAEGGE